MLPGYAVIRAGTRLDLRLLLPVLVAMAAFSFFAYRSDKRRAESGMWRVSESTLHLADLLGGWPGGFIAQRLFRHKTSKVSFQVIFWFIVFMHQFLALDSTLHWRLTIHAYRFIRVQLA